MKVVLAFDLGTTGNRVIAFSRGGGIVAQCYYEFNQAYPRPGWVEQDPEEIWHTAHKAFEQVVAKVGISNIVCIGITNQRETVILWDKATGKPVYPAIVWQCRRTVDICSELKEYEKAIKQKTGLPLDPYFSGSKIKWLLDNVDGVRAKAESGQLLFGTVDTWVLWKLTGGAVHATEPSNASRTLCFNIKNLCWDNDILGWLGIPEVIFPNVVESGCLFGNTHRSVSSSPVPITGILGDQQAALFGQGGWMPGNVKNTYGTGLFLMGSTGQQLPRLDRLINTIAWKLDGKVTYAFEGSAFIGGACIKWLRDKLGIIKDVQELESLAGSLENNEGVYFVPALSGLGAPYWDSSARGLFIGMTQGTDRRHFARSALEAIAYQVKDVLSEVIAQLPDYTIKCLRVDGGASANNFLMQFQSDILGIPIDRPLITETTAFGAAGVAGIHCGFWDIAGFGQARKPDKLFKPELEKSLSEKYYNQWKGAVSRSLKWQNNQD